MAEGELAIEAASIVAGLSEREQAQVLEVLRRFAIGKAGGPFARLLGIELESSGAGKARMRMTAGPSMYNPLRIVHGGALFTLVDSAMAMALVSAIDEQDRFSGVEVKINYLAPTKDGELICDAWVRRAGGRVAVVEAEVVRPDGELVAVALGTSYVIRKPAA